MASKTHFENIPNPMKLAGPQKGILWFVFFVVFSWILLLTQGYPMGDYDDWAYVLGAHDAPWSTLLDNFLTPWSQSGYWDGQSDRMDAILHRRIFQSVANKAVSSVFGFQFFPFYIFQKALIFAGTCTLLFSLLRRLTGSQKLALGGLFFYLTVPAHYPHLMWIADPVTMVHFFVLAGVTAFLSLWQNFERPLDWKTFGGPLMLLFIFGWFGIKTKEPGLVLPLMLFGFCALQGKRLWQNRVKTILLLMVLALLAFQIVPVRQLYGSAPIQMKFDFENVKRMFLLNYDCGYENETATAFFSWDAFWPVSIARTFGFFALWFLVGVFATYWIYRLRRHAEDSLRFLSGNPLILICLIWVSVDAVFMGRFQPDPRYFSGTMIPLTILSVRLIQCVAQFFRPVPARQRLLWAILVPVLAVTVFQNFNHILWLRGEVGKRNHRFFYTAKAIYEDLFPDKAGNTYEIGLFYASQYAPWPHQARIKNYTFHTPLPYEDWNKVPVPALHLFADSARKGARYWVTHEKDPHQGHPDIEHLTSLSGINRSSLFEKVLYRLKRKQPAQLHIYTWVGGF